MGDANKEAPVGVEGSTVDGVEQPHPDDSRKPAGLGRVSVSGWKYVAKKAFHEFGRDQCGDLAAALTYFGVLSLFPALLALISLLGLFGQGAATLSAMLDLTRQFAPADMVTTIAPVLESLVETKAAGFAFVFGILGAVWSASGYVGAFGRAMNRIYEVDEGRPVWVLRPQQVALTVVIIVLAALVLVGLVISGPLAEGLGRFLGLGELAVLAWSIAKWPVMLGVVVVMVGLLYYFTPNVHQPKIRWVSPGAVLAIVVWVVVSLLFGLYVANFGSYQKTYGVLAGVIVFLLWMQLSNAALLFGAEFNSELERYRELRGGIEAEEELQLPARDERAIEKAAAKREDLIGQGTAIREEAVAEGVPDQNAGEEGAEAQREARGEDPQENEDSSSAERSSSP